MTEKTREKKEEKKEDALAAKVEKEEKKIAVAVEEKLEKEAETIEKEEKKIAEKIGAEEEKASASAVEKAASTTTKTKNKTKETAVEREYIIPLRKETLKTPRHRRAKKAIRAIKEFLVRHMQVRDRDLTKIKIDMYLNNEIWFRGIKKPANKIRVKAIKRDDIIYAELAELPETVKYTKARHEKRAATAEQNKEKKAATEQGKEKEEQKEEDKDKDGVADKKEEKEDAKSKAELDAKTAKTEVQKQKHTTKGAHAKKTMPVQKKLK